MILAVYGTRPEEIKLWPLWKLSDFYFAEVDQSHHLHQGLIEPDERVNEADLHYLIAEEWDGLVVQGDTRTAYTAAMLAFHNHVPVFHVEAGLRTGDLNSPHPEEGYRAAIDAVSTRLYCPTEEAYSNLGRYEQQRAMVTGQTSIDTLLAHAPKPSHGKTIVVTAHRNEALVGRLAKDIAELTHRYPQYNWRVFAHPNAQGQYLTQHLPTEPPLPYKEFVQVLAGCHAILTDSGGLQEEAAVLGKPCLVMRSHTERPYGQVVTQDIVSGFEQLTAPTSHPFGDGQSAGRILEDISAYRVHLQPSSHR